MTAVRDWLGALLFFVLQMVVLGLILVALGAVPR